MMTNQKASLAIKAVHYKLSNNGERKGKKKRRKSNIYYTVEHINRCNETNLSLYCCSEHIYKIVNYVL